MPQKDELMAMFKKIKMNGKDGITDGGELLEVVSGSMQTGGLAQAAAVTAMLMKNWVAVWEKLQHGLEVIMNWIESAWNKVKDMARNFWGWLISLFN